MLKIYGIRDMKAVFYTLQRLRDQEKKEKQRELAKAEELRVSEESELDRLNDSLNKEGQNIPVRAGDAIIHDQMLLKRGFEVTLSEQRLEEKEEVVSDCKDKLLQARQKSRIMEELILSLEDKEALERKRQEDKITDEIGVMSWLRNQAGEL
jgi:flagellar export protein FliJ